ncbi:MAG: class I SAM-dependent methyltransferase [Burkholderiales bacterium]
MSEPTNYAEILIETVAAYWNARPCNIRHSRKAIGTREFFDEVEQRKYFVEPHILQFAEFERWRGKRVLEVGCGIGTDTINFARSGAQVTAVDLSEESLSVARKRADTFGVAQHVTFFQADAERLNEIVAVEPYDLVYSFGVIHHTPHPRRVIENIVRYLTPGSEFRMMVYAKNSWKNIMIDGGFDQPEAQSGCPIAYTYTHDEVRILLAGLEVTSIKQDHIFPFVVEKYVKHEYEIVPWFAAMPREMFRTLEETLGWHLLVKANLPTPDSV